MAGMDAIGVWPIGTPPQPGSIKYFVAVAVGVFVYAGGLLGHSFTRFTPVGSYVYTGFVSLRGKAIRLAVGSYAYTGFTTILTHVIRVHKFVKIPPLLTLRRKTPPRLRD